MFNKNGSNNGNGSANGVHKDAAVVARNGNGHKPEAASAAEHELLWDGLAPAVTQALGQPLDSQLVSQRKGRGGKSFDYLEGHIVIAQANRIFGYGGWGYELVENVTLRRIETVDPQTGEVKVEQGYSAPVRVTVAGRAASHRHRRPPGGGGHLRRPRHGDKRGRDRRSEAGIQGLRGAVRQRVLRRPAAVRQLAATAARPHPGQRQLRSGTGQLPPRGRPRAGAAASPRLKSCGSGSSRSPPSRAWTRTRCGPPWWTGRARASTTWTAPSSGRWWKPQPTSSGRCSRPRPPKPAGQSGSVSRAGPSPSGGCPARSLQDKEAMSHDND